MTSSGVSRLSSGRPRPKSTITVICFLTVLVAAAGWWCFHNRYILFYGDAQAHLNTSRSIIDSLTPGYDQIGTVWLPVLHVICLPFVSNDWLWSTGLAGTLPVALCFIVAGTCLFRIARESYGDTSAAVVAVACFALNPNVLYLATIPMTEIVFTAGILAALLAVLRFTATQRSGWVALAIVASWIASLTRYDGWFLIPFLAVWLAYSSSHRKILVLLAVGSAMSMAPLYWIAHNWWEKGNGLDFYNGPYSAMAIQGGHAYPGYHDWIAAIHYYAKAGELCAGANLIMVGAAGAVCAYRFRVLQPIFFLLLTPAFYIWSMHSSGGSPIYIPSLWPHSYYNSRYGIALVLLCALAAGALVLVLPGRLRRLAPLIPLFAVLPWLVHPSQENWICWKESEVNSIDRRAWTKAAADFLSAEYKTGTTILTASGDVTGIYCRAQIHLSETINIGNGPLWMASTMRPDLMHRALWTVDQAGDPLSRALIAAKDSTADRVLTITTSKYSPALNISRRTLKTNIP